MGEPVEAAALVVDASVLVDLLAGTDLGPAARAALRGKVMHAPAHLDVEVLSALGRLHRAGLLDEDDVERGLRQLSSAPVARHDLPDLLTGAWSRRADLRLADALYVELADRLGVPLLTTDRRLARAVSDAVLVD